MPAATKRKRKKQPRVNTPTRLFAHFLKIIISPLVLFWDSFRSRKSLDTTWLYSLMLLMTLLLGLFLGGYLLVDGMVDNVLYTLADPNSNQERLSGDVQSVIRYINKYALENQIDPNLIYAIVKAESSFNEKAVSVSGACGLMQLMPAVWREHSGAQCSGLHSNAKVCSSNCIFDPEANIRTGVKYFRMLLDRYNGRVDLALEAYNAGFSNVRPGREPKYAETRGYLEKTLGYWQKLRLQILKVRLECSLYYKDTLKWLLGGVFFLWLVLFWWINQKLFKKNI